MPYDRSAFITRTPAEGVCLDYANDETSFIARSIFPPKVVDAPLTKVYQADGSKLRALVSTKASTNSDAMLVDEQLFATNVSLEQHKVAKDVNPHDVKNADVPQMLDVNRARRVATHALLLSMEAAAATLVTTTANYPSGLTSAISSGSRWNEAGGNPESDAQTAHRAVLDACGRSPNAMAMDFATYSKLRVSPYLVDRIKYTNGGAISDEAIKALFNVEHLFIGKARLNSGMEGAANSIAGLWSTAALLFVHNPSPAIEDVSFGHCYTTQAPFWTSEDEIVTRRGPAGAIKRVTVGMEYALGKGMVVSASDSDFSAGYLFTTSVA